MLETNQCGILRLPKEITDTFLVEICQQEFGFHLFKEQEFLVNTPTVQTLIIPQPLGQCSGFGHHMQNSPNFTIVLFVQFLLVVDALNEFLVGIVFVLYFGTSNLKVNPECLPGLVWYIDGLWTLSSVYFSSLFRTYLRVLHNLY